MPLGGADKVPAPVDQTVDSRADHAEPVDRFPSTTQVGQRLEGMGQELEEVVGQLSAAVDSKIIDEDIRWKIAMEAIAENRRAIILVARKVIDLAKNNGMTLASDAVEQVADKRDRIERLKREPAQIPEHVRTGGQTPTAVEADEVVDDGDQAEPAAGSEAGAQAGEVQEGEKAILIDEDEVSENGSPPKGGRGRVMRVAKAAGEIAASVLQVARPVGGR